MATIKHRPTGQVLKFHKFEGVDCLKLKVDDPNDIKHSIDTEDVKPFHRPGR